MGEALSASTELELLRHHGDVEALDVELDFAVNVIPAQTPAWLREKLAQRLDELTAYPSPREVERVKAAVAKRHRRSPDEVMLLNGAAEGFALLPQLKPRHAIVVHPSFTEPEYALRQAGCRVTQHILDPPYALDPKTVPPEPDLLVIGNPTNPTSVLHNAADIIALATEQRVVVVDEAFMDCVLGETESLASQSFPNLIVIRSLTKMWGLAGLRCGYLLAQPDLIEKLETQRPHWPVGTLVLQAIAECVSGAALDQSQAVAHTLQPERAYLITELTHRGFDVARPAAGPFVLASRSDAAQIRARLRDKGIAIRRGDTFPGLTENSVRIAVRDRARTDTLLAAIDEIGT